MKSLAPRPRILRWQLWLWSVLFVAGCGRETVDKEVSRPPDTPQSATEGDESNGSTTAKPPSDPAEGGSTASSTAAKQPAEQKPALLPAIGPPPEIIESIADEKAGQRTFAQLRATLAGHKTGVQAIAVSPDGKLLASGAGRESIWIWDLQTGQVISRIDYQQPLLKVLRFSADGTMLAAVGDEDRIWRLPDATVQCDLESKGGIYTFEFSPDGKLAMGLTNFNLVHIWDTSTGKIVRVVEDVAAGFEEGNLAVSPDGETLAVAGTDNQVVLLKTQTGKVIRRLAGHSDGVSWIAWSPDGITIASSGDDDTVRFWNAKTGDEIRHSAVRNVSSLAFSPLGKVVVGAVGLNFIQLATRRQSSMRTLVDRAVFTPDGAAVISRCDFLREITIWDVEASRERATIERDAVCQVVAVSPDGRTLATAGEEQPLCLFDLQTGELQKNLIDEPVDIRLMAFAPDGKSIAIERDHRPVLIDVATGKTLDGAVSDAAPWTYSLEFAPDGSLLAGTTNLMQVWRLPAPKRTAIETQQRGDVISLHFLDGAKTLVAGDEASYVNLWNLETGELKSSFLAHDRGIHEMAVSPDGTVVATSGEALPYHFPDVFLWDLQKGQLLHTLRGHTEGVRGLAFLAGGERLLSCSDDGTLKLWDPATGQLLNTLYGHTDSVLDMAVTADGKTVVTTGEDQQVKIWDAKALLEPPLAQKSPLVGPTAEQTDEVGTLLAVPRKEFEVGIKKLSGVEFAPGAKTLALYGLTFKDNRAAARIEIWDAGTLQSQSVIEVGTNQIPFAFYTPDGRSLVAPAADNAIAVRNAETGAEQARLEGPDAPAMRAALSSDGNLLASFHSGEDVLVWNLETEKIHTRLETDTFARAMAWAGENTLCVGQHDKVEFWDVSRGEKIRTVPFRYEPNTLVYSPAGDLLAVGGGEFPELQIWHVTSGQLLHELNGHASEVMAMTFARGGSLLVSTEKDGPAILWDVKTGRPLARANGLYDFEAAQHVAVSPDGSLAVTLDDSDNVRFWNAAEWFDVKLQAAARALEDGRAIVRRTADGLSMEIKVDGLRANRALEVLKHFDVPLDLDLRDSRTITLQSCAALSQAKSIRSINLSGSWGGFGRGLVQLRTLPRLEALGLGELPWLSDEEFSALAGFDQLKSLDLSENELTDDDLAPLANLVRLTTLNLSQNDITDDGLKHLTKLKKLRKLNVEYTDVTPAGLEALKHLEGLEVQR